MTETLPIPAGYVLSPPDAGFLSIVGPLYERPTGDGLFVLALRAGKAHQNRYGVVHGGMLSTLADVAIGVNLARAGKGTVTQLTLNLSIDFIDAAHTGDWIEAHVRLTKTGGRVCFGDCELRVGDRIVTRAHATFYVAR